MSSCVQNKLSCDIILPQWNTRLSDYLFMKVIGTMEYEQIAKTLIGGRFATMRYKEWMGCDGG